MFLSFIFITMLFCLYIDDISVAFLILINIFFIIICKEGTGYVKGHPLYK